MQCNDTRPNGLASQIVLWVILVLMILTEPAWPQADPLPWESDGQSPIVARPATPRDLLAAFDVDDQQLETFVDQAGFAEAERSVLQRILFRLPQISVGMMEEWADDQWRESDLQSEPRLNRGLCFALRGTVRRIDREMVPATDAVALELPFYHRALVELDHGRGAAVVFARTIPRAWEGKDNLAEPFSAHGLFIKTQPADASSQLVFAASRLAWFPTAIDPHQGVRASQLQLARLGMDIGLFDDVRDLNRRALRPEDRTCFYELLAAVGRETAEEIRSQANASFNIGELLERPQAEHGQLMTLRGSVRRVTKVLVDSAEIQRRLGIRDYYQLDLFVPLGNQVIKFGHEDAAPKPTFSDHYPVTVCTRTLPAGLAEGQDLNAEIRVSAAFFKLWAYRSRFVSAVDEKQLQLSPMFVGVEPILVVRPAESRLALLLGAGFLLILSVIWILLWRTAKGDKRFATLVLRRNNRGRIDK